MDSALERENLIIKWLFAESISYRNHGHSVDYSQGFKWATYTRMQKIIFTILDQYKLPITRSWYKWGGFVHSDELNGEFTRLRAYYSRNPEKVRSLRLKVETLDVPVKDIQDSLGGVVKKVIAMPSKEFLPLYYRTEAPPKYRDIYVSKQEISNFLDDLALAQKPRDTLSRHEEIQDYITQFHSSSSKVLTDERISDAKLTFTDLMENSLDKLKILCAKSEKISKSKLHFFEKAKEVFDDYIWNSYACEISSNTVVGLRSNIEKQKMKRHSESLISQSKTAVSNLEKNSNNENLELTVSDLQVLKRGLFEEKATAKALSDLMGIYSRANDGD
jgi:hypothetical protein